MSNTVVTYDIGNTNPHLGVFHGGKLEQVLSQDKFFEKYTKNEWENFTFIISQVGNDNEHLKQISNKSKISRVKDFRKNNHFGLMPIQYQESLGDDRLIQAYYLFQTSNAKNILLIDAGTFITIDFINRSNKEGFLGGYIFPGLKTYLKNYARGAKLPVLEINELKLIKNEIPHTTQDAILGSMNIYIESVLKYFNEITSDEFEIILTGGDAPKLIEILKSITNKSLFLEPDLIHHALNFTYQSLGEKQ